MSSIKDRDGPGKKEEGRAGLSPNARPPGRRRQILDQPLPIVMDWAMMGKPLLSTQPENPSANRKMAPPIPCCATQARWRLPTSRG